MNLIARLTEALEQMTRGVNTPAHAAAIMDAIKYLKNFGPAGWNPGDEAPKHGGQYLACYHFGSPPVIHFYGVLDYYLTAEPEPHWQHTLQENGPIIDWWMPIPHLPDEETEGRA